MPTLKDVAKLLGIESELKMAAEVGLHVPISTLALIQKYEQLPPKARFSVVPTSGTMPLAVQFTDQSLGYITKRDWNFGNGEHSGDPNPPHTYRWPEESFTGSAFELEGCLPWNPSLTVSNKGGSDTASATVTVYPARPLAKFSADPPSGPAPLTVSFAVDRSAGYCLTHQWNFGDPDSGAQNTATTSGQAGPNHKYRTPGSYNVVLEVSNSAGISYGGATIVATGGTSTGPGSSTDTPHIDAGRVPGYSTISVSGNKFTANAAITITVTKDKSTTPLASANASANSEGLLASTDINVPSCAGTGYTKFVIDVEATEAGGKVSNQVQIDCYTSDTP